MNQELWETLYAATDNELFTKLKGLSPTEILILARRLQHLMEVTDAAMLPDWDEEER